MDTHLTNGIRLISCSLATFHKYGNSFHEMLKLRHKGFIMEERYDIYDYDGLEFDQYDNPFTIYMLVAIKDKIVACTRLGRTDIPYMAKDIWANQIPNKHLPSEKNIYELTRLYVDSAIPSINRTKITRIILGYTYLRAKAIKAKAFYFVTHQSLINALTKLTINTETICELIIQGYNNQKYCLANVDSGNIQYVEDTIHSISQTIDM